MPTLRRCAGGTAVVVAGACVIVPEWWTVLVALPALAVARVLGRD